MATERVFKIPVFGGFTTLVFVCIFASPIPFLVQGFRLAIDTVPVIISLCAISLVLSFKSATVRVDEKFLRFSSGFRTARLALDTIERTAIVDEQGFPAISYKIWAYALLSQKNGIFRMGDGRKSYIAGTAEKYFAIHFIDFDVYIALNEGNDALIVFANEFISDSVQKS